MVDFNSRVQYNQNNQIVGIEVTVFNENNDQIGEISVADASTLNELRQALNTIDETYFTQDKLLNLLANNNEDLLINATRLNGFQSDSFAKTNHSHSINDISYLQYSLNKKSNVIHRHDIADINGLYTYEIACDKYNVAVGETVTITGSVKDARGDAVSGESVEILVDSNVLTCSTNASGIFSTTYSFDSVGLHTFSVKNQSTFVNVSIPQPTIQKVTVISGKCDVYYEPTLKICNVLVNGQFSIGNSGNLGNNALANFKPKDMVAMAVYNTGMNMSISNDTGQIHYVNNAANEAKTVVASAMYFYK